MKDKRNFSTEFKRQVVEEPMPEIATLLDIVLFYQTIMEQTMMPTTKSKQNLFRPVQNL